MEISSLSSMFSMQIRQNRKIQSILKDITDKYNQIKQNLQDIKIGTQLTGKDQLIKDLQDVIKTYENIKKNASHFGWLFCAQKIQNLQKVYII